MDFHRVEVNVGPGQTQRFATAQPENEDQHISGIQRVIVTASGFEELPGFFCRPSLPLALPRCGKPHDCGNVSGNQFLGNGIG